MLASEEQKAGCLVTCLMFLSCTSALPVDDVTAGHEMAALTIVFLAIYIRLFATRRMGNRVESCGVGIFYGYKFLFFFLLLLLHSILPLRLQFGWFSR